MISHKIAQQSLDKLKKNFGKELPLIVHISKMEPISEHSKSLIHNRISVPKYYDRYASKRALYKPITIQFPSDE